MKENWLYFTKKATFYMESCEFISKKKAQKKSILQNHIVPNAETLPTNEIKIISQVSFHI